MMRRARRRPLECEFVVWDGSDEAFKQIRRLTAVVARRSYKLHDFVDKETGRICVPTPSGIWEIVHVGDYVFVDPTTNRRHLSLEEFLFAYEEVIHQEAKR